MFGRKHGRRAAVPAVEFCDSCGQVCTDGCRAEARRDRVRLAAYQVGVR